MTSVNFSIKERGSGWLYKLRPVLGGGATVPLFDSGPVSQVSFIVVSFLPDSTLEKRIGREEEETHLRHPHTRFSVGLYLFSVNDNGTMLPWISGGKLRDVYKLEEGELVLQRLMVWCVKCLLSNGVSSIRNGLIFRKLGQIFNLAFVFWSLHLNNIVFRLYTLFVWGCRPVRQSSVVVTYVTSETRLLMKLFWV